MDEGFKKYNWQRIKDYLLHHEDCKGVHKMVWEDHAWITDRFGRWKITMDDLFNDVKIKIQDGKYTKSN